MVLKVRVHFFELSHPTDPGMSAFLSVFQRDPEKQKRRWTFHFRQSDGYGYLLYIFKINAHSVTLTNSQFRARKFKLLPRQPGCPPWKFVFEAVEQLGRWSKYFLTFSIHKSYINVEKKITGLLYDDIENLKVIVIGESRMFI